MRCNFTFLTTGHLGCGSSSCRGSVKHRRGLHSGREGLKWLQLRCFGAYTLKYLGSLVVLIINLNWEDFVVVVFIIISMPREAFNIFLKDYSTSEYITRSQFQLEKEDPNIK